jgi:predicted transcriptional regulator
MAMTLRLPPDEQNALRRLAEAQQRSIHDVVREALQEYVLAHTDDAEVEVLGQWAVERYRSVLDRLA